MNRNTLQQLIDALEKTNVEVEAGRLTQDELKALAAQYARIQQGLAVAEAKLLSSVEESGSPLESRS